MNILIVDDSATIRVALERFIRKLGHQCATASDGQAGWEQFQSGAFDAVVSDWLMPGVDGLELCRRVRAAEDRPYTYFILVTALEDKQHVIEGMEAGVDDYLVKPVDPDDLKARLIAAERVSRLHRQLAHERGRLHAIVGSTPIGLLLTEGGIPVYWNSALLLLVGISDPDPHRLEQEIYASVHDAESVAEEVRELLEAGGTQAIDLHTKDGRCLEMVMFPCGVVDGQPSRGYLLRDVSREREVDRMKSEFVALASHELRTPLTTIKGYVDLLLDPGTGSLSPIQQEFAGTIQLGADRLMTLINDLLDLSRIEAGGLELARERTEVRQLVDRAAAMLRMQYESKHQQLDIEIPNHLPAVDADPDRINQVLINLLSNAYKYTPAEGRITVTARSAGEKVELSVKDTGIGMSLDDQTKLFTKFFRARNPAARKVGGTGLGLTISKSLVEMHGGSLTFESTLGEGSTFTVSLPVWRG
ncbi:MAG TPA: ATP-binding protein [Chloroflexota bacterium]|nr:ATP-binding protein [Chloroflexota bacterium]